MSRRMSRGLRGPLSVTDALPLGEHLLLQQAVTEAGQWEDLLKALKVEGKIYRFQ